MSKSFPLSAFEPQLWWCLQHDQKENRFSPFPFLLLSFCTSLPPLYCFLSHHPLSCSGGDWISLLITICGFKTSSSHTSLHCGQYHCPISFVQKEDIRPCPATQWGLWPWHRVLPLPSQSHHAKLTTEEKMDVSREKQENEHIQHPQRRACSNGRTLTPTPQCERTYRALCSDVHSFDFTMRDWLGESLKLRCHTEE